MKALITRLLLLFIFSAVPLFAGQKTHIPIGVFYTQHVSAASKDKLVSDIKKAIKKAGDLGDIDFEVLFSKRLPFDPPQRYVKKDDGSIPEVLFKVIDVPRLFRMLDKRSNENPRFTFVVTPGKIYDGNPLKDYEGLVEFLHGQYALVHWEVPIAFPTTFLHEFGHLMGLAHPPPDVCRRKNYLMCSKSNTFFPVEIDPAFKEKLRNKIP